MISFFTTQSMCELECSILFECQMIGFVEWQILKLNPCLKVGIVFYREEISNSIFTKHSMIHVPV